MRKTFVILAAGIALTGCADKILSDNRIQRETAAVLNVSDPTTVQIRDRKYDGWADTSYVAVLPATVAWPGRKRTVSGTVFHCHIDGGNVHTFGLTNPPVCSRL